MMSTCPAQAAAPDSNAGMLDTGWCAWSHATSTNITEAMHAHCYIACVPSCSAKEPQASVACRIRYAEIQKDMFALLSTRVQTLSKTVPFDAILAP
jgi:hypothetical protein